MATSKTPRSFSKPPSLSIKLSALCPRYEPLQGTAAVEAISGQLLILVKAAREANITVTIDAEESERLELSLEIFQRVFSDLEPGTWQCFGLAVQAYQKRTVAVLDWLIAQAKIKHCKIPVRLVKGAY